MKKLFMLAIIVSLSTLISVASAQDDEDEDGLIPPGLPVITPGNVDQVVEIAALGHGGQGQLYWSPDGKTLAMNNAYGIWLHDAHDLTIEPRFIPEPSLDLLHFSDDSTKLVAWKFEAAEPVSARVWDVPSAEQITDWDAADISANPGWRYQTERILTGPMADRHSIVVFWDIVTNTPLYRYRVGESRPIFSTNRAVATINDRPHVMFDVATGEPIWLYDESGLYSRSKFHALTNDGSFVLMSTFYNDGTAITLHRASDGEEIRSLQGDVSQDGEAEYPTVYGFTPDDETIIGRSGDMGLVWRTQTGELVSTFRLFDIFPDDARIQVTILENRRLLAQASNVDMIALFDLTNGKTLQVIHQPDAEIFSTAYSGDGCCIASVTHSGLLTVWEVGSDQPLSTTSRYQTFGDVKAISPDGRMLITIETPLTQYDQRQSTVFIRETQSARIYSTFTQPSEGRSQSIVAFHPDGKQFTTTLRGPYSVEYQDWVFNAGLDSVWDIAYSPDGAYLVMAAGNHYTYHQTTPPMHLALGIYSADMHLFYGSIPEISPGRGGYSAVAFSPDGRYIAADRDGIIHIWDFASLLQGDLPPLALLKPIDPVGDLAFSPDSTQLLAGYALLRIEGNGPERFAGACAASLWDVNDALNQVRDGAGFGVVLVEPQGCITFEQPSSAARYVSYSPNGDMILIHGGDYQRWTAPTPMTLVDASTGKVLRRFDDQLSFVMSPDGTFMISEGSDQRLHYWGIIPQDED